MAQAKRNFNSIKVRLEQVNVADSDAQNLNFNSIKVRLEPAYGHHLNDALTVISIP